MHDGLQSPILIKPIPKQIVKVGAPFHLNLTDYVQNSLSDIDLGEEDLQLGLLYTVFAEGQDDLPYDLNYTLTGDISGQLRPPALEHSPYRIIVEVSNGSQSALETSFELVVLPADKLEDEWFVDTSVVDEFSDSSYLSPEEEQELNDELELEEDKDGIFTEEKKAIWQAILQGESIPELQSLLDRPITHHDVYHMLSRLAYFVIWNADNSDPAGEKRLLYLQNASNHFHVYDRGSCIVATPKKLFDHNRTLLSCVKTAQAMAYEVFNRGWTVEFGGFDKMVRAAWIEFELLSQKYHKEIHYAYFSPSAHDLNSLNQTQRIR